MVKTWLFGPSSGKNSAVAYSYRRVSVGGQGPRAVSLLDDRTCRCQTSGQPGFHDITSRQTPPPPVPRPSARMAWNEGNLVHLPLQAHG